MVIAAVVKLKLPTIDISFAGVFTHHSLPLSRASRRSIHSMGFPTHSARGVGSSGSPGSGEYVPRPVERRFRIQHGRSHKAHVACCRRHRHNTDSDTHMVSGAGSCFV